MAAATSLRDGTIEHGEAPLPAAATVWAWMAWGSRGRTVTYRHTGEPSGSRDWPTSTSTSSRRRSTPRSGRTSTGPSRTTGWRGRSTTAGGETKRLDTVRRLGLRAIPSLTYAYRPGMARWLTDWCTEFAARVPDAVRSATLFPEASAAADVRRALAAGGPAFQGCTSRSACSAPSTCCSPRPTTACTSTRRWPAPTSASGSRRCRDLPTIPHAHELEALDRLDLGEDWMRAVLWENGARLLSLS